MHTYVNLSADALAIPGGYVVPERGKHSPVLVAQVKFCFGMLEWLNQMTASSTCRNNRFQVT